MNRVLPLILLRSFLCLLASFVALAAQAQDTRSALTLKTSADFLALHVTGQAPSGTTQLSSPRQRTSRLSLRRL